MSNEACLIANDIPGPVGVDFDTHVGYDPRTDLVANAPMAVPVYWLSLHNRSHLATLEVAGEEGTVTVPSLVAKMRDARRLLKQRRQILLEYFPEFQPTWDTFARCVVGLESRYIKVELQELWDMDPEEFLPPLDAALRWFDTQGEDDFAHLLEIASIYTYDKAERTFRANSEEVPRAFHLRGYSCSKGSWDDWADP
jgi:hypothetical protein